ncbi:hypothetical protein G6F57_006756 [Rhizopus arrhizus]|uniref:Transposase Tc1-like domain-containing protein n=1 Tax=Rhizopus oryzae TaxID=64495 RepID=A0A9P6X8T6_RHIOR|nr:hypothetical protein G6F23_001920 [Rhizopus arrhizus]KAG1415629.1 hypothetical protein G6F58_006397 [Rhizopus delemar]KAG0764093.1 hypothetical protein G6F24_005497 [Rhizopus arrhizus]KAG0784410.1 hypothetical protein G6F21_009921 [Rhizopus arrhizus]KAG0787324.1 hypothetical protein G6F22_007354 [Rhizopus arrhizus]
MELAKLDVFVSIETLRSCVDQLDFKSYRAAHKPRLTARHRKSRLCWAKEHLSWTEDKGEMFFGLMSGAFVVSTVKWGDDAMIWGCFWKPLEIIETGSIDQETYINILTNRFHPWFTNVTMHQERDFIFRLDGASCHTGGYAQCPDLNPIEHVWNALERQIERKGSLIKNLEQLKVALQEWARLDDEFAERLVRSMKRRYKAVIKAKGDITEY